MERGADRLAAALLALELAIAALLVWIALAEETPLGHGGPHPRFATLQRGGTGERSDPVLVAGLLLGVAHAGVFTLALALGFGRRLGRAGALWIASGGIAYAACWVFLVWRYTAFASEPTGVLWLGLPPPTALLLCGLWPFPLLFAALYVIGFERLVLSGDDLRAFRAQLGALRDRGQDD